MSKMRPVVFVIDKTCGGALDDAMQAMDWVFAEARNRGMGKDVCVLTIGYDYAATIPEEGILFLEEYFWAGMERSVLGGYIDKAIPLIQRFLDNGKSIFEDPIVVFLCKSEPCSYWRGKIGSLEAQCSLFDTAQRIAIHLGDGEETSYLWTLAGFDGKVAHSISELRQMFSEALLGDEEASFYEALQELLSDADTSDDGWNSGWGGAENARESFSEPRGCAENARMSFFDEEDDDDTIVNDLDDDPADEGFGGGWGGMENARETFDDGDGWTSGWGGAENARESYYEADEQAPVTVSDVQFSAVSPKQITKGDYAMIDITVYEESYRHIVDSIISGADGPVRETFGGSHKVQENAEIRIALSSPDIDVSDCDETQIWQGKYLVYSFPIEVPSNYAKRQILLTATVYFDGVIATRLKMIASCQTMREQKLQIMREDVLSAFISYASQDRSRVATIIQGMKKARPDMDIFFDVESLRSGEDWGVALRREIEARDVLYLCWSHHAKLSQWVEAEWRYALSNKGLDAIEPIPLEPPTECPPPEELNSKHFNDRTLLYK